MMDFIKASKTSSDNAQRGNGPTLTFVEDPSAYINTSYESPHFEINVPPCDAQDFHGSYEEWPSFRDMFTAVYISKVRMPDVQKLLYLRQKCKGEASSIVNKYPLTNDGFPLAWKALRARYENKRILVDLQLKALFNIPPADLESPEAINNIQTTISDCLALLSSQGINVEQWDPILIYLCCTKLPTETLALWEQSLVSNSILPSWSQMEQFLIKRHRVVERIVGMTKEKFQDTQSSIDSNNYTNNQNVFSKNSECILCRKNHNLRLCSKFLSFSLKQRNSFVSQNEICKNCLSLSHRVTDCISRYRCDQCGNKHHSLLHISRNYNSQNSIEPIDSTTSSCRTQSNQITNNQSFNRSNQIETPETSLRANNSLTLLNTSKQFSSPTSLVQEVTSQTLFSVNQDNILLPTALVQILHSGNMHTVRALIDSGSKRSLLTENAAR